MLGRGDLVPHFEVQTTAGRTASYGTIWQQRNLVLVAFPADASRAATQYAASIVARRSEFAVREAECVMTREPVSGLRAPAVLVADRWGEIVHLAAAGDVEHLPDVDDLLDWIDYTARRCPECEGEAR